MDANFWKGKNVLITGVNGFIGSSLAKHLVCLEANVIGILRNESRDTLLFYEKLNEKIKIINGDIIDLIFLKRVVVEEQIHICFHLAAQVEVGVARNNPYLTWETNIKGTYCLLEAFRENSEMIQSIVIASSDKSYGSYSKDMMPYKEDYPLIPEFPYDVSKACADMIARTYASSIYSLPIVVTRFSNIYGPGQMNFSALIPDCIRSALGYSEFIPRGDGTHIRDFIFVNDVADLYCVIAENITKNIDLRGEVFNAGTNNPKKVKEIIEKIYTLTDNKKAYEKIKATFADKKTIGEIDYQYMDHEKLNKYFGWSPKTDFDSGLQETIEWYGKYLDDKYGK